MKGTGRKLVSEIAISPSRLILGWTTILHEGLKPQHSQTERFYDTPFTARSTNNAHLSMNLIRGQKKLEEKEKERQRVSVRIIDTWLANTGTSTVSVLPGNREISIFVIT